MAVQHAECKSLIMPKLTLQLQSWSKGRVLGVAAVLVIALAVMDALAPPRMSFTLFHVVVIAAVGWLAGFRASLIIVFPSALVLMLDQWRTTTEWPQLWVSYWNLAVRVAMFALVGYLSASVRQASRALANQVVERTEDLERTNADLQRSQATLRQSEQLYRDLILHQGEGLAIVDLAERFTFVNPAGEAIFGVPPNVLCGRSLEEFTTPEAFSRVREQTQRRCAGEASTYELQILRAGGEPRWLLVTAVPHRDETGEVRESFALFRDITERKRAEAEVRELNESLEQRVRERTLQLEAASTALRESEQRYRAIFEGAPVGILLADRQTKAFHHANPAICRMLGYPVEELVQLKVDDIHPKASLPQVIGDFEAQSRQEKIMASAVPCQRKDGTLFYADIGSTLVVIEGQPMLAGFFTDITERKKLEQALREGERRFRAIFEQAAVGVAVLDSVTGRFLQVNQSYCEMIGRTAAQMLATDFMAITHPDDLAPDLARMEELKTGLIPHFSMDKRLLHGQGGEVWVHLTVSPMWTPGETPETHIAVVQDITGRRTAEAALRQLTTELEARVRARTAELEQSNAALQADIQARKMAEDQLRKLSLAVEQSPASVVITDTDGNIEHVNAKFTHVTGYQLEEVFGKNPRILKSGETKAEVYAQLWATITSGKEWHGEFHNRKKNGELFWESALISPVVDETGRISHFVGVKEDITERKKTERWTATFARLGEALAGAADVKSAARVILDAAQMLFTWDAAYVDLYDRRTDRFLPILTVDTLDGRPTEIAAESLDGLPTPLSRLVRKHGAQLLNRGKESSLAVCLSRFGDTGRQSESRMYVPIRKGGEFIGILSIQSYLANAYVADHLADLQTLADFCSSALQRITAVEALRDSEERFRILFESSPIAIALHSADGHILEANPTYQRMLGYTGDELRRLGVKRITHPSDVAAGVRLYGELFAGKRNHYQRQKRYLRKDGTVIWGSSVASAIRAPDGRLRYIMSLVEDITERRQAELAMRELAAIVEHSTDAIFSSNLDGDILTWNNAAERISGYTAAEVIGKPIKLMLSPPHTHEVIAILAQLRSGSHVQEFETVCRHKDGKLVPISITAAPVKDSQGRVVAASAIARDITGRKQLEEEILRIGTEERRHIGHELHDGLGQLLTGIAFKAKALQGALGQKSPPAAAELGEVVSLINGAISQTRRLAQGLDPIEIESAGLVAALRNLALEAGQLFGIECSFTCSEEEVMLNDQTGLAFYRIAQEAINNAHTHGAAKRVDIELVRMGERLELIVRNNGRAFTDEQRGRTGMGLRIMRHRARAIGGTLSILAGTRRGTTIICSVPFEFCQPGIQQETMNP